MKQSNIRIATSCGHVNVIHFPSVKFSNKSILCIHGSYCDARIFNYIASRLSENGFNVYSMDLLGHGKSDGPKGDPNFDDCLTSINEVIKELRGSSQMFILGHSLGCTFALWYAHNFKNSINGVIVMAPYVRIRSLKKRSIVEPSLLYLSYLFLRKMLTPNRLVKLTDILPRLIVTGGEEMNQLLQDKDLNFYYSYRYIIDVIALRNSKISELADIDVPIIILHGKNDLLVFSEVSKAFFKEINNKQKKIKLFDCDHWFYDAVFYNQFSTKYSEESRKQITRTIIEWIDNK